MLLTSPSSVMILWYPDSAMSLFIPYSTFRAIVSIQAHMHFNPLSKHFIIFSSVKEELLEIWLLILLALLKSNALAEKLGYTLDNFWEAIPIFLLLILELSFSCSSTWPGRVNIVTACLWQHTLMFTETLGSAQSIFPISKSIRQEWAFRSYIKMKQSLQICGSTRVANYRIWNWKVMQAWKLGVPGWLESSLMIHLGFVVNWLVGTLRKGIRSWG